MNHQIFTKMEITGNAVLIEKCAKTYCQVWREPPWNEFNWSVSDVVGDINEQLQKPGSQFFFAGSEKEIFGFTWGYFVTPGSLRKICGGSQLGSLFEKKYLIFYIDELAVSSKHRKLGIGKSLSQVLLSSIGTDVLAILRTNNKAKEAVKLYRKLGFTDLGVRDSQHPDRTYWEKLL